MNKLQLSLLLAFTALAGCRREQPPTEVPPSPLIETFTASGSNTAAGAPVTLSWKARNGTSLELREATLGALNVPPETFEGSLEVHPTSTSLYVLIVRGPTGNDTRAVAVTVEGENPAPTFQALPSIIPGGSSTTLAWIAPGARQVELKAGTQIIDVQGQRTAGAVTVRPLEDTEYSLTVDGRTLTAQVQVQAAVLHFVSDHLAVEGGDPVSLSWDSAGATRVVLKSEGRGVLFESTTPATVRAGSFTDTAPSLPAGAVLSYELTVEKGTQMMSKSLEVFVGVGVTIVRLDAKEIATQGSVYTIRWSTLAADKVEVLIDGATAFLTANPAQALSGNVTLLTPPDDFTLELIATNVRGGRALRSAQVDVVGVPTAVTASASPTTITSGSSTTLSWESAEARHLRITDDQGQPVYAVTGQVAESGSVAVFPSRASTTYTVSTDNGLGSTPVTTTVTVTVTGSLLDVSFSPAVTLSGGRVSVAPSENDALLVGFPHSQVLVGAHADFIDISTTGEQLDMSAGVRVVPLNFSTWLWGQRQTGSLSVSRAGWMSWSGAPFGSLGTGAYLLPDSQISPPFMIAPLWTRLVMAANSAVYLQVMGTAPHEKLIVQWTSMQMVNQPGTEMTFQVQVEQTGAVSFQYRTVELTPGDTTVIAVGVQDGTRQIAVKPSFTPVSDSALYFFGPVSAADVQVARGSKWGGFVQKNGVSALVSRDAKVVSMPFDLAITEAMLRPSTAVDAGQYLELLNRTQAPLELTGWSVSSAGASFTFPDGVMLQPDQPFVLGASDVPEENDDAGVQLSWADAGFALPISGTISLGSGGASYSVSLSPSVAGTAAVFDPGPFRTANDQNSKILVCNATTPFGGQAPQQLGNPGSHGGCGFGYRVMPIAEHFVDVTDGGTALVNSPGATVDALTMPITLAPQGSDPAPLLFGNRAPIVSMSIDGWLSTNPINTVSANNKTSPDGIQPRGLIAPFWDDLQTQRFLTPESDLYWKRMAQGEDALRPEPHWIFQWHRVSHRSFLAAESDDLSFEVKLFEDGTIEYHYADLRSGSFSDWSNGNSATVWLERPDGGTAITLSANSPDVKPHTAWRFIPQ